jgi:hypothetical protein
MVLEYELMNERTRCFGVAMDRADLSHTRLCLGLNAALLENYRDRYIGTMCRRQANH